MTITFDPQTEARLQAIATKTNAIRGLFTTDELDTLFARSRSLSRSVDLA